MARLFNDASTQYLKLDTPVLTAAPLTLACWFNSDDATILQTLVCISPVDSDNDVFRLDARGDLDGDVLHAFTGSASPTGAFALTSAGYTTNTWHHACGVFAAANDRTVYLDGGNSGNNTTSVTPNAASLKGTAIGVLYRQNILGYMSGLLAEVGIWNVGLTAAEVASLAKGFSPLLVRPQSLITYVPILGNLSPEQNLKNASANFTLNGTPSKAAHPRVLMATAGVASSAIF
jgi:hypothetical protein